MADRYVLALDVGTQSARAIVFDAGGALVARAQVAFTPYHSAAPGWAEQDVAVYWAALRDSCHTLWNEAGVDPANIEAVSLTTQGGSVVCVDERGVNEVIEGCGRGGPPDLWRYASDAHNTLTIGTR